MTPEDVYHFYGSVSKASKAIQVTRQTFHNWIKRGFIPYPQQRKYEALTKGKLACRKRIDELNLDNKKISWPCFRYYCKKHGMCHVRSITYLDNMQPRIIYFSDIDRKMNYASFDVNNIMQASIFYDIEGRRLYEKDIILVRKKEIVFESVHSNSSILKNKFLILGNTYEGKK